MMKIVNQIYNPHHYSASRNTELCSVSSLPLKKTTIFLFTLLLGTPLSGLAQNVTFQDGDEGSKLTTDPNYEAYKSLVLSEPSNNNITIVSGSISGRVFGGYSSGNNIETSNNTVNIYNGTVGLGVYGGYAYKGNALNNSVTISGGAISGSIYGGYTTVYSGSNSYANGNSITISGGNVNNDVYGGYISYLVPNRINLLLSRQSAIYQAINNCNGILFL